MTDIERLEDRLTAVERAVVDGDHDFDDLTDLAAVIDSVERIDDRLGELEERVAKLEARADSVEGYVANVDSINEDVEKQAASAMASVESLEKRIESLMAQDDVAAASEGESGDSNEQNRSTTGSEANTETAVDDDEFTASVDELVSGTERDRTLGQPNGNGSQPSGGVDATNTDAGRPDQNPRSNGNGQGTGTSRISEGADGSNTVQPNGGLPPDNGSQGGPQSRAASQNVGDGTRQSKSSGSPPKADPETMQNRFGTTADAAADPQEADDEDEDDEDGGFLASLKSSLS